jgi:hypothetical protein
VRPVFDLTALDAVRVGWLIVIGVVFMFASFWVGLVFVVVGLLGDVIWIWLQRRSGQPWGDVTRRHSSAVACIRSNASRGPTPGTYENASGRSAACVLNTVRNSRPCCGKGGNELASGRLRLDAANSGAHIKLDPDAVPGPTFRSFPVIS